MAGKIFINYRRDDSAAHALNVAQYLEREFGKTRVFLDIDRIGAGANFPTVLRNTLTECGVMLVVIGPSWLTLRDKNGNRRIDDPSDWVHMEIAHAINKKIPIIPVLVGGAALPEADQLPGPLQPIVDQQGSSITTNGFKHEMAGLAQDVRAIIGSASIWPRVAVGSVAAAIAVFFAYGSVTRHVSDTPTADAKTEQCERYWDKIKDRDGEDVLQTYISECRDTFHGRLAAARLSELKAALTKEAAAAAESARLEESKRAAQQAEDEKKKRESLSADKRKADEEAARKKAAKAALGPPAKDEDAASRLSYFTWQTSPNEVDPGLRVWTRQGETTWKEIWPSGTTTTSQRIARIVVDGCNGSVLGRTDEPDFYIYLPDRGCNAMIFRFRRGTSGPWIKLATMRDIR